jgi:hypothetical protein
MLPLVDMHKNKRSVSFMFILPTYNYHVIVPTECQYTYRYNLTHKLLFLE